MSETVVRLDDHGVTIDDVLAVARGNARVELTENALAGIAVARARVDDLAGVAGARSTASPRVSARWPTGTSRRSCAPSCSAR